jgi:3',5'-cyclic AMP phosphodiesterase CpdA
MILYAISDLHVSKRANWDALRELPAFPGDWLLVAGDVCSHAARFAAAMRLLTERFERVFWTPGNHDLWTHPKEDRSLRGVFKYNVLVQLCRELGVVTPEDPYVYWPEGNMTIAPIFTLYDYSFRPNTVPFEEAVAWAAASNIVCNDEYLLHPDPFASRQAWCAARLRYTETRLTKAAAGGSLLLLNHYPLRRELVRLRRIPRFSIWCGSEETADWHTRFGARQVVSGHLHIRTTDEIDGVQFDEVSLGYPGQWNVANGVTHYLREIRPN